MPLTSMAFSSWNYCFILRPKSVFLDTGAKKSSYNDVEFSLNSQFYGTGVIYKHDEKNEFTFSVSYIHYDSENGEDENFLAGTKLEKSKVTYKKGIIGMGIGYTYKF